MTIKPLAYALLATSVLTACSTTPLQQQKPPANEPFVYTEPELSPPFYALNPFNYEQPPVFELELKKASAQQVNKLEVTDPANPTQKMILETNKLIIPTINSKQRAMKYAVLAGDNEIDITAIDDFLQMVEGKARHYPPQFTDRQERKGFESKLKEVSTQLDQLASKPDASFDILIRAFKASILGRNLDLGSAYTTKSLDYAQRILKINKEDPEANLWFGFSLSEGGGQKEALPYLDKATKQGVQEAYLSTANTYLGMEQKKNAIQTLKNYKVKYPSEAEVADRLIQEIEKQGRYNVWQILKNPAQAK
ncbi:ABUW_2363 family tetratricopeptide repeat lipoprotein [Acinetobacter sp. ULE_I010]|uniref:ABUW_2363 family tetratricopeptide repeat lipoprotein n=1 Tax=Acinetobacter sp. ULE_I010 TaxID=3373065 RepID=UPI003AF4EB43